MLEEESQKWCLKSLKLNLAQKMQKCEAKTNVSLKGLGGGQTLITALKKQKGGGESWDLCGI